MICSPLLVKQYFPSQRRPAFTDWKTRCRLNLWATVLYEPKFGPPTSKIPGSASEFSDVVGYDPESIGTLRNTALGYLKKAFVWVHNSRRLIISIAILCPAFQEKRSTLFEYLNKGYRISVNRMAPDDVCLLLINPPSTENKPVQKFIAKYVFDCYEKRRSLVL